MRCRPANDEFRGQLISLGTDGGAADGCQEQTDCFFAYGFEWLAHCGQLRMDNAGGSFIVKTDDLDVFRYGQPCCS